MSISVVFSIKANGNTKAAMSRCQHKYFTVLKFLKQGYVYSGTVAQWLLLLHNFTQLSLKIRTGSNPACGVSEIRYSEDFRQRQQLEIKLNAFRRSVISQKQFIISSSSFGIGLWHQYITNITYNRWKSFLPSHYRSCSKTETCLY